MPQGQCPVGKDKGGRRKRALGMRAKRNGHSRSPMQHQSTKSYFKTSMQLTVD